MLAERASRVGAQTILVESDLGLAAALREAAGYEVRLVGRRPDRTLVTGFRVLTPDEKAEVTAAARTCGFAATAVGGRNLPEVARLLADVLPERNDILNILVCENRPHAAADLQRHLERRGAPADAYRCVPCSVERMVRPARAGLDLVGESAESLYLDAGVWSGKPPDIPGLHACESIEFYYARKLFTNNAGHAVLAYEGHLAGYELLCEANADPTLRSRLEAVLAPATAMLESEFGADRAALGEHVSILIEHRFGNRHLADTVRRVARDPLRKLAPEERLVGLLRRLQAQALPVEGVCRTIAAALHYRDPRDRESRRLAAMIRDGGPERVLTEVCQLDSRETVCAACARHYWAIGAPGSTVR